jgi:hypothetical protein
LRAELVKRGQRPVWRDFENSAAAVETAATAANDSARISRPVEVAIEALDKSRVPGELAVAPVETYEISEGLCGRGYRSRGTEQKECASPFPIDEPANKLFAFHQRFLPIRRDRRQLMAPVRIGYVRIPDSSASAGA